MKHVFINDTQLEVNRLGQFNRAGLPGVFELRILIRSRNIRHTSKNLGCAGRKREIGPGILATDEGPGRAIHFVRTNDGRVVSIDAECGVNRAGLNKQLSFRDGPTGAYSNSILVHGYLIKSEVRALCVTSCPAVINEVKNAQNEGNG